MNSSVDWAVKNVNVPVGQKYTLTSDMRMALTLQNIKTQLLFLTAQPAHHQLLVHTLLARVTFILVIESYVIYPL